MCSGVCGDPRKESSHSAKQFTVLIMARESIPARGLGWWVDIPWKTSCWQLRWWEKGVGG